MKADMIEKIENLIKSENWQDRYNGINLIKENSYDFRTNDKLSYLWRLIKKCLRDKEGRVRNNAVYAFKTFRGAVLHFSETLYVSIFREIYAYAKPEKNVKIRKNYLRCLAEMDCPHLEFLMQDMGIFDEYSEVMDFVERETKGKYEHYKGKNDELFEKLARKLMEIERASKFAEEKVPKEIKEIWKGNEEIAERVADAYFEYILLDYKPKFIEKGSKEGLGYNCFIEGIRFGMDVIIPMLSKEKQKEIKDKIERMIKRRKGQGSMKLEN